MCKKPLPIVTLCHRVIKSNREPSEYRGKSGLPKKLKLLKREEFNFKKLIT